MNRPWTATVGWVFDPVACFRYLSDETWAGNLITMVDIIVNHGLQCPSMIAVVETEVFQRWMERLKDSMARARILARLRRVTIGNLGDWKPVGGGVSEMRIDHGPGYRVYFARRGERLVIVLAGGTKSSQSKDIARAIEIAEQLE